MEVGLRKKWKVEGYIREKHINESRLWCLDVTSLHVRGTIIWYLCKIFWYLISKSVYWVSGNGKIIWIWEENILRRDPLNTNLSLQKVKWFLVSNVYKSLFDISNWVDSRHWQGWKRILVWDLLDFNYEILVSFL